MALVGGARNHHVLSNKCCGFVQVQVQNRSNVKEFGTFWVYSGGGLAVDAPLWMRFPQRCCSFVTCAKARAGSSLTIDGAETRYERFLRGWRREAASWKLRGFLSK
jgi:hypothetical protein